MFKKLLSLIFALLIALSLLTSCKKGNEPIPSESESQTEAESNSSTFNDGKLRIFANGEYQCKIIRPENITDRERKFYNELRNTLKEVTGVMPAVATDFKSHDEVYNSDEFAILVGSTEYEESSTLYSSLSYSDFKAELINKKYTLAFHDLDTAYDALKTFKELLTSNFKDGEIILTDSWNYSYSTDALLEDIPKYAGGIFFDVCKGAYGMQTIIIKNTNADDYNKYLTTVLSSGYTLYTDNSIGENLFATFESEKYILTTMLFPKIAEARVTLEYTGNYSLPALESENVYTPTGAECSITQIGLEETTQVQNGMSYVIKLADGSFIVFDGGSGTGAAREQFMDVLSSLADDPDNITIAAWILTHAHGDHIGVFWMVASDKNCMEKLTIEQIIWSKVADHQIENLGGGTLDTMDALFKKLEGTRIVIAHPGQVFYIRNATYTVYGTTEMIEPIVMNNLNDSSIVGRIVIDGKSMIFPGDSHPTGTAIYTNIYGKDLKSDVVQVIHHGYQGGSDEFYSNVDPLIVLWPLGMKNYETATPPNTPMKTWSYSAWLFSDASHVQQIYVAGSEVTTLLIKDIPSHTY